MRSPTGPSLAALRRLKLRRVGDNPPYLRLTDRRQWGRPAAGNLTAILSTGLSRFPALYGFSITVT